MTASRVAAVALLLSLAGCGTIDRATTGLAESLTPYRADVVQGIFVSREQVQALAPGMSRLQVRDILGTPLVTSLFHANRWDYVFTLRRAGVPAQARRLSVFFEGERLLRFEGDEMPTESEFVAGLDTGRKGRVPVLEATEEQLRAAAGERRAPAPEPAPPAGPLPAYPPLESR